MIKKKKMLGYSLVSAEIPNKDNRSFHCRKPIRTLVRSAESNKVGYNVRDTRTVDRIKELSHIYN